MRDRPRIIDGIIAAGLLIWALTDVPWWWRPAGHSAATPIVLGYLVLALLQSVPFAWVRRWPVPVAAVALAVLGVRQIIGVNLYSATAAAVVASYSLGAYGGRRTRTVARYATAAVAMTAVVVLLASTGLRAHALALALVAAGLGMGETVSAHRDLAASAARHAQDQERNRLARELHDVIAHQLSAIAVQAGAARVAAENDPSAASRAVATIELAARQGLIELNHLVGSLRHDPNDHPDRMPQPHLADLPALIHGAREAGLPVELKVAGPPCALPTAVELAAYRVVQESITNSLRYAPGAPTQVQLTYTSAGLDVTIEDEGSDCSSSSDESGGGHGLAGLAERATILGGRFEAGPRPRPSRGFAVHAWLPTSR
jgi:signal transduction histidine kinase